MHPPILQSQMQTCQVGTFWSSFEARCAMSFISENAASNSPCTLARRSLFVAPAARPYRPAGRKTQAQGSCVQKFSSLQKVDAHACKAVATVKTVAERLTADTSDKVAHLRLAARWCRAPQHLPAPRRPPHQTRCDRMPAHAAQHVRYFKHNTAPDVGHDCGSVQRTLEVPELA